MKLRIDRCNDNLLEDIADNHLPTLGIPDRADADSVTFDVDDASDAGEAGDVLAALLGDQTDGPWTIQLEGHAANDDGDGLRDGEYYVLGCARAVLYLYPTGDLDRRREAVDPPVGIGDCASIDLCEDAGEVYVP